MNCFSSLKIRALLFVAILVAGCNTQVSDPASPGDPLSYRVDYALDARPADGVVEVSMTLTQSRALLREVKMRPDSRLSWIKADGELSEDGDTTRWHPPATGGTLTWQVLVNHRRNGDGYDAWLGPDFGLFRAEDVIPRMASRTLKGARSESSLSFTLPAQWSAVTPYFDDGGHIRIDNPERRLDQPSGWIVIGDLGVRRERIAGVRVAIAGPVNHSIRRLDTLAMLHWTLPDLARLIPELPARLSIVSAGDPMWRGGLSGPQSLFLHSDRPLISENGTSTLLHEIMHMSLRLSVEDGYDWIVEGLAEYYSLQLLQRSGTISKERYAAAMAHLADWAKEAGTLCKPASTDATTAFAVGIFAALDAEIVEESMGEASLDDLVRATVHLDGRIDGQVLRSLAEEFIGGDSNTLHGDKLPGCRTIASEPVTSQ